TRPSSTIKLCRSPLTRRTGQETNAPKETFALRAPRRLISRMFQTVASPEAGALLSPFRDEYIQACRWMLLARTLDEKFASLYRAGKIHGGVFLGRGQEALSVS